MAYLAIVGSKFVNGVAAIHTEILKQDLFRQFYDLWPEKFQNKTNGVTPRRWLAQCNPPLRKLITETLGTADWEKDLDKLRGLLAYADDKDFQAKWAEAKYQNKLRLAKYIKVLGGCMLVVGCGGFCRCCMLEAYSRWHIHFGHMEHGCMCKEVSSCLQVHECTSLTNH